MNLDRYPKAKRGATFKKRQILIKRNNLFDIFYDDKNRGITWRRSIAFACAKKDYDFYQDQKTIRIAKCTATVEKLTASAMRLQ